VPEIAPLSTPEKHGSLHRDPYYLFACHLEWRSNRNLNAYQQLVAALDDCDEQIRSIAQDLLQRCSPRPQAAKLQSKSERP